MEILFLNCDKLSHVENESNRRGNEKSMKKIINTLSSKIDIENLISELHELFPQLDIEDIETINQARDFFLQLDLLVRSELFKNTMLEMSDSIIELSDNEQKEFLGFMKKHDVNVKTKFHELLFGNYLKKLNFEVTFQPEYDKSNFSAPENNITLKHRLPSKKKKDKLVPDWKIKKNNFETIVEVFTLNEYDDYRNEQYFVLLLCVKLKELENQYNINFSFNSSRLQIKNLISDSNLIKNINSIITDIENWLGKNQVTLNTRFDTFFGLEVIISDFHITQKMLGGGARSPRLIESFENKYIKYKDLMNQIKMPLILTCVSDCIARASCDEFEKIIFGLDNSPFSRRKEGVVNKNNKMPEVSGFMLLDYNLYSPEFNITYIQNPNAKYPIELEINKKCNKINNESIGWFL